jgi:hypothetical protein
MSLMVETTPFAVLAEAIRKHVTARDVDEPGGGIEPMCSCGVGFGGSDLGGSSYLRDNVLHVACHACLAKLPGDDIQLLTQPEAICIVMTKEGFISSWEEDSPGLWKIVWRPRR